MDIMKCLIPKGLHYSLSGSLYPVQGSKDCALALYFNNNNDIKSHCFTTVNTITTNSITQPSPNHYLISLIQSSFKECRYPGYTDCKITNAQLALITIPKGCSIFTLNFIIPGVNSVRSEIPTTLRGYQSNQYNKDKCNLQMVYVEVF